jgi:hypothetical protein
MRLILVAALTTIGCSREESPLTEQPSSPTPATQEEESPMADQWPFHDAENTAVITLTRIVDGSQPILYVVHDEDGDWQFLDGGDVSEEDAATVSLRNVCERDPSIKSLADLPLGWAAERVAVDQEWQRFQR